MTEDKRAQEPDERPRVDRESRIETYGRGVRTALRNNATAYGFSISITAAYGLVSGARGMGSALATVSFAVGAAVAFVLLGSLFVAYFPRGRFPEGGQVATLTGDFDLFSVVAAVAAGYGTSKIPGFAAWPLTAFATVAAYLLVGGLDVLIARGLARRSSFGRSQ